MALEFSNGPAAAAPAAAAPVTPAAAPVVAAPAASAPVVAAPVAGATPAAAVSSAATAPAASATVSGGFLDGPVDEVAPVLGADGKPVVADDAATVAAAAAAAEAATAKAAAAGVKAIEAAVAKMTAEEKAAYDALSPEAKAAADAAVVEAAAKAAAAPVYTDFTIPKEVGIDPALMEKAKATFAAQGLSQEQAQAVVDFYSGDVAKIITEAAAKPYDLWRDTQAKWQEDIKADAEIGGAKMQAAMANGARAIDLFSTKDEAIALRQALAFTGATNNPAIARFFARVGARISDGKFVPGNAPTTAPKTAAEVLFPNHGKAAT